MSNKYETLSSPLQEILKDLRSKYEHDVVMGIGKQDEYYIGIHLINQIKKSNVSDLIEGMKSRATKQSKSCKHKRKKWRMTAWAEEFRKKGEGKVHQQGFVQALTCRDCGVLIEVEPVPGE